MKYIQNVNQSISLFYLKLIFFFKISIESNLSDLFAKQYEIFDFKHKQENLFLDDIKFILIF